ncbi:hypothetical protein RVV18_001070 [Burkholderia ambifaria]|nr:hypothetical protein [Burkholderia ambifaria]
MPASLRGIVCGLLRNPRARISACLNIFNALIHKGFVSSAERVAAQAGRDFGIRPAGEAEISASRPVGRPRATPTAIARHIAARDFLRTIAS